MDDYNDNFEDSENRGVAPTLAEALVMGVTQIIFEDPWNFENKGEWGFLRLEYDEEGMGKASDRLDPELLAVETDFVVTFNGVPVARVEFNEEREGFAVYAIDLNDLEYLGTVEDDDGDE